MTTTEIQPVPTRPAEDLWKWTDCLTTPQKKKLERDAGGYVWIELPPLLTQLEDDLFHSGNGGGGRTKPGSKPPLNVNVLSLLGEMEVVLVDAVVGEDLEKRDTLVGMLRQITAHLTSTAEPDVILWWAQLVKGWAKQAESCLPGEDDGPLSRPLRDAACPDCKAWNMQVIRDGDPYREPVLAIVFREGLVRHVHCRLCGFTAFRGEALFALADTLFGPRRLSA